MRHLVIIAALVMTACGGGNDEPRQHQPTPVAASQAH
jgi:uncharacterized lipoprotein YmbA